MSDVADAQPPSGDAAQVVVEAEPAEIDGEMAVEPIPIDTTAELLGRAKPKRPRSRLSAASAPSARGTRKAAARKPSTRRAPRTKKAPHTETPDEG
jgi:hypothetical protein